MFYGMVTPVALFFRLIGRDTLSRRHRPEIKTYWVPKRQVSDLSSYFRPF
jgi:hypothetical protein